MLKLSQIKKLSAEEELRFVLDGLCFNQSIQ